MDEDAGRPIEILLVEDNPWDARVAREALARSPMANRVTHVKDGVEALAHLRAAAADGGEPPPDMILLDLNLPRKDGRAVLAEMGKDPLLRAIPVIVLSSSKATPELLRDFELRPSGFLNKPFAEEEYASLVHAIEDYWFMHGRHPARGP